MKKLILPVLAVMAIGTASAQFNVGLSVGYGIGTPGQILGTEATMTSQKNIYGTLGGGLNINLLPGYSFGEHFGVELGLNGFIGTKMTIQDVNMSVASLNYQRSSNQFRISPAFVIKSGGERLNVYAKAGLIIPVLGSTISKIEDNRYSNPLVVQSVEAKTTGKLSVGFTGAFGASLNLGPKFSLFAEVGANSIQVKSKETKYTKIEANGTDALASATEFQKRINYVDEINGSSNTMANPNMDPNKARDELRQVSNFSSFFLQVGFKITFGD